MEALARGIREMVDTDDHVRARVGQVEYLGDLIAEAGVPDRAAGRRARGVPRRRARSSTHLPQDQFPAQALAAATYRRLAGCAAMERGIVSAGRNKETGDHNRPRLELVRLTIPRRVYTQSHMDVVAESVAAVYERTGADPRAALHLRAAATCGSSRRGSSRSAERSAHPARLRVHSGAHRSEES